MKTRCIIIVALALLLGIGVQVLEAETRHISLQFDLGDFRIGETENGLTEIFPKVSDWHFHETSDPGLPYKIVTIAVPEGEEVTEIKTSTNSKEIGKEILLAPNPIPIPTDGSVIPKEWIAEDAVYSNEIYPVKRCEEMSRNTLGNLELVHFCVSPFEYNVKTGTLGFVENIEISIEIVQSGNSDNRLRKTRGYVKEDVRIPESITEWAAGIVSDEESKTLLGNMSDESRKRAKALATESGQVGIEYIIITNEELKPAFQQLADWKTQKGVPTVIETVESIYKDYPAKSRELSIKEFLYELYQKTPTLKYGLLGGDDTVVPVAYYYEATDTAVHTPAPWHHPSDLYYACYGGDFDWDANKNGIRCENKDKAEYLPSFAITRLPAQTKNQVSVYVKRLLEYERQPKYNHNIFMAGRDLKYPKGKDGNYLPTPLYPGEAERGSERLYNSFKDYWSGTRRRLFNGVRDFDYSEQLFRPYMILDALKKGFSFADIISHGGKDAWACDAWPHFMSSDAMSLVNDKSHMIITTMACDTNWFDNAENPADDEPCLCEAFIQNENSGVIAYLGCSRSGWYNPGDVSGSSTKFNEEFYNQLFARGTENRHFGIAVNNVKMGYSYYTGYTLAIDRAINPVGDAEVPIFVDYPKNNSLEIGFVGNALNFAVGSKDDNRVCICPIDGDIWNGYRIWNNVTAATIAEFPKEFSLTVTAPGFLPISKTVSNVQNKIMGEDELITADIVRIGSDVCPGELTGDVVISSGTHKIECTELFIQNGVEIKNGAEFKVLIK